MSEFFLFRKEGSIGPSFNEGSQKLLENRAVTVKQSRDLGDGMGMMLIDVAPQALASVQTSESGHRPR